MSRMKPFRFGANVWSVRSRAEWADKARTLEDRGYSALTVSDHLADVFAPIRDAFAPVVARLVGREDPEVEHR